MAYALGCRSINESFALPGRASQLNIKRQAAKARMTRLFKFGTAVTRLNAQGFQSAKDAGQAPKRNKNKKKKRASRREGQGKQLHPSC